jgi:phosphoenolpyruvate phosphomutase
VIVPTKYPTEPLDSFVEAGVTNFIFANHSLRTVVTALQRNLKLLHDTRDLMSVEREIAPVKEIFRLQNVQELQSSEERYLPQTHEQECGALVLAASKGDFGDAVKDKPKAMLRLKGRPILTWHTDAFRRLGIRRIGCVRGYCKDAIDLADIRYFDNDDYARTGELASLAAARDFLRGDLVIAYGDIVFDDVILRNLIARPGGIRIAVDGAWKLRGRNDDKRDLVVTSGVFDPLHHDSCTLQAIGAGVSPAQATGEWIGLVYLSADKTELLAAMLDELQREDPNALAQGDLPLLLERLRAAGETISVVHSYGHWYDLDEARDLVAASSEVRG